LVIHKAANVVVFGVIVALGMYWVSQPVAPEPPPIDNSFDIEVAKVASLGGLAMSGVALLLLIFRWLRVRKILSEGTLIKGLVEDLHVVETSSTRSDSVSRTRYTRRSCYAVLRYVALQEERTVRLKLPNSGFVYGLVKGQETDLMVHDSTPKQPLICSIYLKRPSGRP
jgi:hypothetical protein